MSIPGQIVIQKRITITGDSASGETGYNLSQAFWKDLGAWRDVIFTLELLNATTDSTDTMLLTVATTDAKRELRGQEAVPDGPIWDMLTFTGLQTQQNGFLRGAVEHSSVTPGGSGLVPVLDRWVLFFIEITGTSGPWSIEFGITATLKG